MTVALLTGFGLGFLVAAQVGPIWLLAARSVIRGRFIIGIMIGLGAATIDMAYGGLGLAGATSLLRVPGLRLGLGLAGAAVLAALGVLSLRSGILAADPAEPTTEISSITRAYLVALGATAANPLTIASWAAVFAAASTARITRTTTSSVFLLAGIGLGTSTWFCILSAAMTVIRRIAGRRVHQVIDVVSGLGLTAFAVILAWQTMAMTSR
jgi:putative LysE/RhtB family amino acid efflux pump